MYIFLFHMPSRAFPHARQTMAKAGKLIGVKLRIAAVDTVKG